MEKIPQISLEEARRLDAVGDRDLAMVVYSQFLKAQPDSLQGWVDYAGLLLVSGRLEEARQACDAALRLDMRDYGALVHSACVDMNLGRLELAEEAFRKAIDANPARLAGRLMHSDCLVKGKKLEEARAELETVLRLSPGHSIALDRLNSVLVRLGDWTALRQDMKRQIAGLSGPEAEYASGHLDLMFGDMPGGWGKFESRLDMPGRIPAERGQAEDRWQGERFPGKTLLISWEQGFGDTLMFLRFLPLVKARGGTVVLEVQPPLVGLAATCAGVDSVVPHGQPLPGYDLHASLLSMPAVFGSTLDSIPSHVPYIDVPELVPRKEDIDELLQHAEGRLRVGVCWAGNQSYQRDRKRSMHPRSLGPLGVLPDVAWYSFQYVSEELAPLPGIAHFGALLDGFENTAHALRGMDLVITVDTVVAHLAGALGLPVFLMLSFVSDWRWMMGRPDSPWYPTMRLYRQDEPGDWLSVVRAILLDLQS